MLTLGVSRRCGPDLLAASREVARRVPVAGGGLAGYLRAHRALTAADGLPAGQVEVRTYASPGAQLEAVADLLRREHLDGETAWAEMAVLVRSGQRSLPAVRRVLGAAGVPLEVAGDELPLVLEAAAAPLLLALRVATGLADRLAGAGADGTDVDGPTTDDSADGGPLTAEAARTLLLSPLGGLDPTGLRRLGRALRDDERRSSIGPEHPYGQLPRPSEELVAAAVAHPQTLSTVGEPGSVTERVAAQAARLGRLLQECAALVAGGASAHESLWALWTGTPWPYRLERAVRRGGAAGRAADRDLDVVVALFEVAARDAERSDRRGVRVFLDELEAQQIPADTLAERGVRGEGVRVLTAHRSKGLEWPVVVVVDVQEDVWPDLGHRGSLLQPERLGSQPDLPGSTAAERLADERRLFYVAVTRARRRLVVTAVDSPEDDGVRPSRFLDELGVPVERVRDRPTRPLTLPALVAELRATAADPDAAGPLRRAAASRLARLAAEREGAAALVPAADPRPLVGDAGTQRPRSADVPRRTCRCGCPARRWRGWRTARCGGSCSTRCTPTGLGAPRWASGRSSTRSPTRWRAATPHPTSDELVALVDSVWNQLAFEAPWRSAQERTHARAALARFLAWHAADRGRELVGTEHGFEVEISVGGRPVVLRGAMDRVEVDADGEVHVVDLKTSKNAPSGTQIAEHVQLGVYQLAVAEGAVQGRTDSGGAELVQLKHGGADGMPKVQPQDRIEVGPSGFSWIEEVLRRGVGRMVTETFPPTPNEYCRLCAFRTSCPAQDEGRQVVT